MAEVKHFFVPIRTRKDMNDFAEMNKVYAEFFGEGGYPARSAIEVARLPKDGLVEIEAIAAV